MALHNPVNIYAIAQFHDECFNLGDCGNGIGCILKVLLNERSRYVILIHQVSRSIQD